MTEGQIERFLEGFNETEDCIDIQQAFHEILHKGGTWVHAQSMSYFVYLRDEGRYDITEYAPMNRATYPLPTVLERLTPILEDYQHAWFNIAAATQTTRHRKQLLTLI